MIVIWQQDPWRLVRTEHGYFDLQYEGAFVTRFDNHRQFLCFAAMMAEAARVVQRPWWVGK